MEENKAGRGIRRIRVGGGGVRDLIYRSEKASLRM